MWTFWHLGSVQVFNYWLSNLSYNFCFWNEMFCCISPCGDFVWNLCFECCLFSVIFLCSFAPSVYFTSCFDVVFHLCHSVMTQRRPGHTAVIQVVLECSPWIWTFEAIICPALMCPTSEHPASHVYLRLSAPVFIGSSVVCHLRLPAPGSWKPQQLTTARGIWNTKCTSHSKLFKIGNFPSLLVSH